MDSVDRKILSILKYGKKRQSEIVALLDTESSSRTIRRHLNNLEETGKIAREGDSGPFYLPNQNRDPIQPKPFADQDEIDRILFNIEKEFDTVSSAINDFYDDEGMSERILNLFAISKDTNDQTEMIEQDHNLVHHISEFCQVSRSKHYVLQNKQNLESFLRIFDLTLDLLENYNPDNKTLLLSDQYFELLFMSTNNLYKNWFNGKEKEEFDNRMSDRAERILSIFEGSQSKFHPYIRTLLTNISREDSKEVYISMVKSNKYDQEQMLEDAFYTYDVFNEIHELLEDLDDAQQEVGDQVTTQNIIQLQKEVVRLYTREIQEIT